MVHAYWLALTSVTRFGEMSPLWQNLQRFWQFCMSLFSLWHNFKHTMTNFRCRWANCHWHEGKKLKNNLAVWSHWFWRWWVRIQPGTIDEEKFDQVVSKFLMQKRDQIQLGQTSFEINVVVPDQVPTSNYIYFDSTCVPLPLTFTILKWLWFGLSW